MPKIPSKIVFVVTFRCQLKCKICNVDTIKLTRNELTKYEIISILENLSKIGISAVDFVGGEIFVRNDMVDILRISRELFKEVAIVTNGIESIKFADFIFSLPLDHVTISLDGANSATHDYIREKGSYDKVISFLRYIKLNKSINVKPFITINTVIVKKNVAELTDILKLADSLNCNDITYQVLLHDNTNFKLTKPDNSLWIVGDDLPLLEEQIRFISDIKRRRGLTINVGSTFYYLNNIVNYYTNTLKPKLFTCRHGIDFITIGPEGKIYLCNFALGDLMEKDFLTIWNSEDTKNSLSSILHCERPCMLNCMVGGIDYDGASS